MLAMLAPTVCLGDLDDTKALRAGTGSDMVFHTAAIVKDWGDPQELYRVNVQGQEKVLAGPEPLVGVDEIASLKVLIR